VTTVWHVILVESHDDSREMYEEWLTWRGLRVTAVATADAALEVICREDPDAVVASVRLPDGNAFALSERIGTLVSSRRVPVLALSACLPDHEQAVSDGRIDLALMKPCLPGELHAALQAAVSGARRLSDGPRPRR
jgi:DNA-binding response OmpR family regulator